MKTQRLQLLSLILATAPLLLAQRSQPMQFTIDDPRPVATAAEGLEARFGWTITYEDPQWLAASEVSDVTASVRRDTVGLSPQAQAKLTRVLVPSGGSFTFTLPAFAGDPSDRLNAVSQMLAASERAGMPGSFQVLGSSGRLHLVPVSAKDAAGHIVQQRPVLDANISIEEKTWDGMDLLEAFCKQVSAASGQRVELGVYPVNSFANHKATYKASGENARDFLSRFLDSVGPSYSWQLFFDPGGRMYMLNIHWVGNLQAEE